VSERHHRLAVDADHLRLAPGVEVGEVPAQAEAGVVDEQVDVDAELGDLAGKLLGFGAEIARDHVRVGR